MDVPETQYTTTTDGVSIAYQVVGQGPPDILFVNAAYISNCELVWDWPYTAPILNGMAARGRFILFDRRGAGLSDKVRSDNLPTLEARMDDIRAVMDAAGSERAVVMGVEDGGALCMLFAATYPERVSALIVVNASSRGSWAPDAPWLPTTETWDEGFAWIDAGWGTKQFVEELAAMVFGPTGEDPEFVDSYWRILRQTMTKADVLAAERMWQATDVRHVLPTIQAPTIVLHDHNVLDVEIEETKYIASQIWGATMFEVGGDDEWGQVLEHIDRFMGTIQAEEVDLDRVLATVLFTKIVDSATSATDLGDAKWREIVEGHDQVSKALIGRYRGTYVNSTGDGLIATFDGPARAVRCAQALAEAVKTHGVEIRAGLHTGEVALGEGDPAGIGVDVAAKVAAMGGSSEVWASSTVKDLTAGSGLTFEDAGEHELTGVSDRWHLYKVLNDQASAPIGVP